MANPILRVCTRVTAIYSSRDSISGFKGMAEEKRAQSSMRSSLEHLPEKKQRELARVVEVIHEELEDALKGGTSEFKKRGRILKIILFGSYARGNWVDEPHTKKGYKSDYDLLVVVNDRRLTDFATYWSKAQDRLMHLSEVQTPVSLIVHSRREVNTALFTKGNISSLISGAMASCSTNWTTSRWRSRNHCLRPRRLGWHGRISTINFLQHSAFWIQHNISSERTS